MFITPVERRTKSKKANSSPKTQYQARPLNADDIQKMSSDELRWHEIHNRQALDAALQTEPKPQKPPEPPTPVSTSSLAVKELGQRMGWTPKEISYKEIQDIPASEAAWHQVFNAENWRKAFEAEETVRTSKRHIATTRTKLQWAGHATDEETEAAWHAGNEFAIRTPAFERNVENARVMASYMQANDLDATKIESYARAFRELIEQGKITPAKPQSADEYLAQHPELHDTRTPPLIATRHERQQNTEAHFANSASATNEGGVTRFVDYGQQKHGVPPESDKYSFKMKVRAMSADELAQRCADDPAFKAALDALE